MDLRDLLADVSVRDIPSEKWEKCEVIQAGVLYKDGNTYYDGKLIVRVRTSTDEDGVTHVEEGAWNYVKVWSRLLPLASPTA